MNSNAPSSTLTRPPYCQCGVSVTISLPSGTSGRQRRIVSLARQQRANLGYPELCVDVVGRASSELLDRTEGDASVDAPAVHLADVAVDRDSRSVLNEVTIRSVSDLPRVPCA